MSGSINSASGYASYFDVAVDRPHLNERAAIAERLAYPNVFARRALRVVPVIRLRCRERPVAVDARATTEVLRVRCLEIELRAGSGGKKQDDASCGDVRPRLAKADRETGDPRCPSA